MGGAKLDLVDRGVLQRWIRRKTAGCHHFHLHLFEIKDELNCKEAYNALVMLMATARRYDSVEKVFEEMSLLGFSPMNVVCIELVTAFVKYGRFMDGVRMMETVQRFKFWPAYSVYTMLIGALAEMHEADAVLGLFEQMQDLGYELNVQLFTTLVRLFARKRRLDAALSLLEEMKSNFCKLDIMMYNIYTDCFEKMGRVVMAWKFFHKPIDADRVTYKPAGVYRLKREEHHEQ